MPRAHLRAVLALAVGLGLAACSTGPGGSLPGAGAGGTGGSAGAGSSGGIGGSGGSGGWGGGWRVETVVAGLENPWDLGVLPDGTLLVTERAGRISRVSSGRAGASVSPVVAELDDVWAQGEGGLMGLLVHPDFASTRRFTTCQTHATDGAPVDVRLVTWELAADSTSARRVTELLTGLPLNPSGRHSGCRMATAADGALLVGTGDSARGTVPQDRTSLGGKVLRIDLRSGDGLPDNPFASSADASERRVLSYGHRNVQGLAVEPATAEVFTVEHGPSVDDEVNRSVAGANYGWDPSRGGTVGGYDESVPMTDLRRFPDAEPAMWSTGAPTLALCGAAFLTGPAWGSAEGALAVTALKGSRLLLFDVAAGADARPQTPAALDGTYGRLRAVVAGEDGVVYVTTSNGDDDRILRVTPALP